ncbi:MAG: universal stress protein [Halorubrum sp.]
MHGSDADDTGSGETTPDDPMTGGVADERRSDGRPDTTPLETVVDEAAAVTPTVDRVTLEGVDRADRPNRISSVLVGVAGEAHSGATVDVARRIAETTDAWIDLFHVASTRPTGGNDTTSEDTGDVLLAAAADRLSGFDRVDRWLVEGDTAADEIVDQSPYYDLVVVGAPTTGTVERFVFGCTTDAVVDRSAVPVVVVESDGPTPLE